MLKELNIENLAIIEKATIDFTDKLNIFSGETGAGKSILIGGINAILGGRTTKDIVRTGTDKAVITALFDDVSDDIKSKLAEYGYEAEDQLLLQREICIDGKSTARINGRAATVSVLRDIASNLIDIHGQQDNRILLDNNKQRELLDGFGNHGEFIEEYREQFRVFSQLTKKLKNLQTADKNKSARIEELDDIISRISALKLTKGEEERVSAELERARNFGSIQESLQKSSLIIKGSDSETGALDMIKEAVLEIGKLKGSINNAEELKKRLDSLVIELDDISSEINANISDSFDEERLAYLEERISSILRLKREFGMETDEIIDKLDEWKQEYTELQESDSALERLAEERRKQGENVKKLASKLSEMRISTAEKLVDAVSEQLRFLDMPDVRLFFSVVPDKITINGMDNIEIMISVNKGEEPKPIGKTASGGELSRIMLAIKCVLAENDDIPTMIFDEIDTGISGRAAQKVGIKLSELSKKRQTLCVTHLAQIAARSDNHLLIEKNSSGERTYTRIRTLDYEEKKREIARIISGDSDNAASLANAEELIKNGGKI